MDVLLESLSQTWQDLLRLTPRIVAALIVLLLFIAIGRLLGRGVVRLLARGDLTRTHLNFFRTLTVWLFALIGLAIGLNVLGLERVATGLVAGGGIAAVVLGFAFRGIGENLLAGFFLAFSRPFNLGDLIQSGDLTGVVRGIDLRTTHVRTADGRDIYIPSSQIFGDPLINYTKDGLRRPSFTVGIDYGDDSERARGVLLEAVRGARGVLTEPPPGVMISVLASQYVELEVYFWLDTFAKGISLPAIRTEVIERCRRALLEGGFTFSSNVATNLEASADHPLQIRLARARA